MVSRAILLLGTVAIVIVGVAGIPRGAGSSTSGGRICTCKTATSQCTVTAVPGQGTGSPCSCRETTGPVDGVFINCD